MPASRVAIDNFLGLRRIAIVGVSRNAKTDSRFLWKELKKRGYDLIPVNPNAGTIESVTAYPDISSIDPPPEGVLLMAPAAQSLEAVRQAVRCGVKGIWFYRGGMGQGAVSPEAVELATNSGCDVIPGECPFMYLPKTGFPHSWHRGFRALTGSLAR